jgi:hypothetical protein
VTCISVVPHRTDAWLATARRYYGGYATPPFSPAVEQKQESGECSQDLGTRAAQALRPLLAPVVIPLASKRC